MNLSAVSVYDNVNCGNENFSKSNVYRTINDLLSINGDMQLKLFCPLCVHDFELKFSLFEHLKRFHNSFLIEAGNQALQFKECPFCDAKFYGKHLTAKHVILHHSKVVKELFVTKDKSSKCYFCNKYFENGLTVVKHIEKVHFLDFEEEFSKRFSCDNTFEVTVSELLNSSTPNDKTNPTNWEDVCLDISDRHHRNPNLLMGSTVKDFKEASKVNCYDFTDLKEQLEKIKDFKVVKQSDSDSVKRSILKDVKNSRQAGPQRSVRRVLRFDLPENENKENKENSVLQQNLGNFRKINPDEHSLLCENTKEEVYKLFKDVIECSEPWCEIPKHSSTPNSRLIKLKGKILPKDEGKIRKSESNFKSYIQPKKPTEFEFQCGKCRKLFKENLDLVCHIKHNHKRLGLKTFQPCYSCAICSARFYKNYYLRKHHRVHNPY